MRRMRLEDGSVLVVGNDREIRSLYKRMLEHDDFAPAFCDMPKFRIGGMYGLMIEDNGEYYVYYVISSDTIARFLATGVIV